MGRHYYTPRRIALIAMGRQDEAEASAALSPGMLLELDSDGKVKPHATEGAVAERMVALEDALQAKSIDDAYADGDIVTYLLAAPGDVTGALIKAGENISKGEFLMSGGDGTLKAHTSTNVKVAVAQQTKDLSAVATNELIEVRWL